MVLCFFVFVFFSSMFCMLTSHQQLHKQVTFIFLRRPTLRFRVESIFMRSFMITLNGLKTVSLLITSQETPNLVKLSRRLAEMLTVTFYSARSMSGSLDFRDNTPLGKSLLSFDIAKMKLSMNNVVRFLSQAGSFIFLGINLSFSRNSSFKKLVFVL